MPESAARRRRAGSLWSTASTRSFAELEHPRRFVLDLPSGAVVDRAIDAAYVVMEPGDVVLDATPAIGAIRCAAYRRMRHRSLYYVDVALIEAPRHRSCLRRRAGRRLWPCRWSSDLAATGRAVRAGEAGAAHFALMVRAGVATAIGARGERGAPAARGLPERGRPDRRSRDAVAEPPARRHRPRLGCSMTPCACTPPSRCWPRA